MPKTITYDKEKVLNQAMIQFWKAGYEATSVQDLVEVTGINRASIYNSFGDKKGLFLAAVDHYLKQANAKRVGALEQDGSAIEAIQSYLEDVVAFSFSEGRKLGCLITNSLVEVSPLDIEIGAHIKPVLDKVEDDFYQALLRAQKQGEIRPGADLRALARFLTGQVQGLRVLARADSNEGRMRDMVIVAMNAIKVS
ncbi:TetR/AcrR family transcriptional regulator [Aestuariispira insulae]|uniref:TetR family transcriptional regulator n=1 Tax=Aestuariispira insulae TaxID=1461337 RepID=A0A3D9HXZ7_9PROT|nr:TetR/AcrR family transcriptional regulator [Aestuariispira insulae]RED53776.1 TetR family transcriptional regulator [Aestuariispira insulae]